MAASAPEQAVEPGRLHIDLGKIHILPGRWALAQHRECTVRRKARSPPGNSAVQSNYCCWQGCILTDTLACSGRTLGRIRIFVIPVGTRQNFPLGKPRQNWADTGGAIGWLSGHSDQTECCNCRHPAVSRWLHNNKPAHHRQRGRRWEKLTSPRAGKARMLM